MSSIVPPDLSRMGRNLSAGRRKNFSFAKNFAIITPTTASGASVFLSRVHQLVRDGCCSSNEAVCDWNSVGIGSLGTWQLPLQLRCAQFVEGRAKKSEQVGGGGSIFSSVAGRDK